MRMRAFMKSRAARSVAARTERATARGARPLPERAPHTLAEGGPRDAAWASGSGAMDSIALAVGGRGISSSAQRTPMSQCGLPRAHGGSSAFFFRHYSS
jgi:hypothetical protein